MFNRIIILDTETTNITAEPWLLQLGYIVCDTNFNELKRENLYFEINWEIDFWSMAIHHITPKILSEKLLLDTRTNLEKKKIVENDLIGSYIVAHNSPFDKNVLDCNWINTDSSKWIDSYNIAYGFYTDENMKHSLQYLRYFLWCEFEETIDAHDAMSDVIVLKKVFEKIYLAYWKTLEELVEQTKLWIILRTWAFGKYKWRTFIDTFKADSGYFRWMYNSKLEDWTNTDAVFNTLKYYLKK